MTNYERLLLLKAANNQINPMSPAASGGFDVGGTNYQLDKGPQQELGSPAQMMAGITGAGGGAAGGMAAAKKPDFMNFQFEPDTPGVAVGPEIMEMGRTGVYPMGGAAAKGIGGQAGSALGGAANPTTGMAASKP
jgi:hypothetical protein